MSAGSFPPNIIMPDVPQMPPAPLAVPQPDLTEENIKKAIEKDKEGCVVRHLGFGSITTLTNEVLRGYVVVRAFIAQHQSWMNAIVPNDNGVGATQKPVQSALKGEYAECVYEVWDLLEDGSIGPAMTVGKNVFGVFIKKEANLE